MLNKNKLVLTMLVFASMFSVTYADDKTDLLKQVSTLETNFNNLKSTKTTEFETKIYALSTKFDEVYKTLWYDLKTLNYLVSLWKISSNLKSDLLNELTTLTSELNTKVASELTDLSKLKNTITLNYTSTIPVSDKSNFLNQINNSTKAYNDLNANLTTKINGVNTKYTTSLEWYKTTLTNVFNSNKTSINTLQDFVSKYEVLFASKKSFDENYDNFKKNYLANSSEITKYLDERQLYYVDYLKKDLEKLRDSNIEANASLAKYKNDFDRYIEILLQNFSSAINKNVTQNFWLIYSSQDIDNLNTRFTSLKNKYYDIDNNLIPNWVLTNSSWALSEVNSLKKSFEEISKTIWNMNWTGVTSANLWNIKVRIDRDFSKFYNDNYNTYREDLYVKLKEKLNLSLLETKNILLASDSIDIRFQLLNDKISKNNNLDQVKTYIADFRNDMKKYDYLNSDILTAKVDKLNNNLGKFIAEKELKTFAYTKLLPKKINLDTQLDLMIKSKKENYKENSTKYFKVVLDKVDTVLETKKLSTKNRFTLLVVKLKLIETLNTK